jgi:hypothetical protein
MKIPQDVLMTSEIPMREQETGGRGSMLKTLLRPSPGRQGQQVIERLFLSTGWGGLIALVMVA